MRPQKVWQEAHGAFRGIPIISCWDGDQPVQRPVSHEFTVLKQSSSLILTGETRWRGGGLVLLGAVEMTIKPFVHLYALWWCHMVPLEEVLCSTCHPEARRFRLPSKSSCGGSAGLHARTHAFPRTVQTCFQRRTASLHRQSLFVSINVWIN